MQQSLAEGVRLGLTTALEDSHEAGEESAASPQAGSDDALTAGLTVTGSLTPALMIQPQTRASSTSQLAEMPLSMHLKHPSPNAIRLETPLAVHVDRTPPAVKTYYFDRDTGVLATTSHNGWSGHDGYREWNTGDEFDEDWIIQDRATGVPEAGYDYGTAVERPEAAKRLIDWERGEDTALSLATLPGFLATLKQVTRPLREWGKRAGLLDE